MAWLQHMGCAPAAAAAAAAAPLDTAGRTPRTLGTFLSPQGFNCKQLLYYDYTQLSPEREAELGAEVRVAVAGVAEALLSTCEGGLAAA